MVFFGSWMEIFFWRASYGVQTFETFRAVWLFRASVCTEVFPITSSELHLTQLCTLSA